MGQGQGPGSLGWGALGWGAQAALAGLLEKEGKEGVPLKSGWGRSPGRGSLEGARNRG